MNPGQPFFMKILGLDLESTGLSVTEDCVIEVGLALWDVERKQPVRLAGFLVKPDVQIPDDHWAEAEKHHHISRQMVEENGVTPSVALAQIALLAGKAEAVVAFNGTTFDRPMYENWCARAGVSPACNLWIDTRLDPPEPVIGKLIHLAAERGFVNPFPHRALFDVMTMLRILSDYDIPDVLRRARVPNLVVAAKNLPFERKDEARDRGYYWEPAPIKQWRRAIKACDLAAEKACAPFQVVVVEGQEDFI